MRFASKAAIPVILLASMGGQAQASKMVIGGGEARQCYLDAENTRPSRMAVDGCTSALQNEPLTLEDTVATYVNRGILFLQMSNYSNALADFDRAIQIDSNEPEAYLNKALTLFRTEDRWQESLPLFDIALAKKTRKPEIAYFARGLANEMAGNIRAAYDDLRMAAQLAPKWESPMKELARYQIRPKPQS